MAFRLPLPGLPSDGSLQLIRRLLSETGRQYTGRYIVAFAFMLLLAVSTALTAWLMKDIVNQIFVDQNESMLFALAGLVVVISICRGIGAYGSSVTLARIGNFIVAHTQRRLFDPLLNLGVDFYGHTHSSELVTRISHNASAARAVLNTIITSFGRDLLSVVGLVIVMVVQSPVMSLFALLIGPVAAFGINGIVRRVRKL